MKPLTKYVKAVSAKSNRLHEQCTNNLMKFVYRNFKNAEGDFRVI